MAVAKFEFEAQKRDGLGKGASRRLRREEKVIGVVYGGNEDATPIILEQRNVFKALENASIYSHILSLNLNGKKQKVVLRDIQRHPYKPVILHMDFMRVKDTDMLNMHIPLHFLGGEKCPGVENGGIINHVISDLEVRCQAAKLPEFIEVDISGLALDQDITLSHLKVPAGVEIVQLAQGHDLPVVSVHLPRQTQADIEQAAEEAAAEEATKEVGLAEGTAAPDAPAEGKPEGHGHDEGKEYKK